MAQEVVKLIPILKPYPIRPDHTLQLPRVASQHIGWDIGDLVQITVDETNERIIITRYQEPKSD